MQYPVIQQPSWMRAHHRILLMYYQQQYLAGVVVYRILLEPFVQRRHLFSVFSLLVLPPALYAAPFHPSMSTNHWLMSLLLLVSFLLASRSTSAELPPSPVSPILHAFQTPV